MPVPSVVWIGESKSTLLSSLEKKYTIYLARSGKKALDLVAESSPAVVILDAVSLKTSGERIITSLRTQFSNVRLIHLYEQSVPKSNADVHLSLPITVKKLMTHVDRLAKSPKSNVLCCGSFILDLDKRTLYAHGVETLLNPKQAKLLELFFSHPNQVIDRTKLMREVWDTDYIGDTGTLNVHIRWVRCALEGANLKIPKFLKTVRGLGYKLEVPV
jgi:DNA-binding response OmpR family regulator